MECLLSTRRLITEALYLLARMLMPDALMARNIAKSLPKVSERKQALL